MRHLLHLVNRERELGLVERAVPATELHPERSKRGSYRLLDHFFRFWFRFVHPNRSLLARGEAAHVRAGVERDLDPFTSAAYEEVCREYVWQLHGQGKLGFAPTAVGRWWSKAGTHEIDVVAFGERRALLGECKWSARPVGVETLDELRRTVEAFQHDDSVRRAELQQVDYALFARAGFTSALRERAEVEGVHLVDLPALAP